MPRILRQLCTTLDNGREFRRLGCHIIPVNGKDKLIQPLAIAKELGIRAFVVFDADGDTKKENHRNLHVGDNNALLSLLGSQASSFPEANVVGENYAIWQTNLTLAVEADLGTDCSTYQEVARVHHNHERGLDKHDLFIADWLSAAYTNKKTSKTLAELCTAILKYAKNEAPV